MNRVVNSLKDIDLRNIFQNAVNAPFMYMVEKQDEPYKVNEKTELI